MLLPDVNVLVYAHRADAVEHAAYARWLTDLVTGDAPFALAEEVLASFVRIVTNPRIFTLPTPLAAALAFGDELLACPGCRIINPGPRRWSIFGRLAAATSATGKLVPDAWLAALAIETGCELATADHDFARFPDLRWHHPLTPRQP